MAIYHIASSLPFASLWLFYIRMTGTHGQRQVMVPECDKKGSKLFIMHVLNHCLMSMYVKFCETETEMQ